MNADQRQEIAASVAAHAELGPRYDDAVAEGLVDRIGEEIDKRVDARLRGLGQPAATLPGADFKLSKNERKARQPAPAIPFQDQQSASYPAHRSTASAVTGMFLGLGSMGLGVGATAVVAVNVHSGAAAFATILMIWLFIAVINVANARHR